MSRIAAAVATVLVLTIAGSAEADAPLAIRISGNHFVNGSGESVQLVGVNRSSTEYACFYGYGYSSGPLETSDAAAIADWHANAVRIPLDEDCWLGLNGYPAGGLTAQGYRQAIASYVQDLNEYGLYAILDLHWSAPATTPANGQRAMPDEHSLGFWTSVAGAFKDDPAVLLDAFNEPYSPAANGNTSYPVSWACWENGGCTVPDASDQESVNPAQTYSAVGMQEVVDAIRGTGATQPILLGGLSYANDLSQWLTHEPTDPDHQLAASFHNYTGESCDSEACWNATVAPVATQVPVLTGEFGEDDCPPSGEDPHNFDNTYMDWADQHGVGYLAWGWFVLEPPQPCSALYLITDYSGTPAEPNGVALHDHLAALSGGTLAAVTKLSPKKGPAAGGTQVRITGTGFAGATAVSFGATSAASFTVNSPATSITAVSPAGTTGLVNVTVTTPDGTSALTSKGHFTFEAPTVSNVSPNTGSQAGGTTVTVTGSGFGLGTSATAFKFGMTPGTSVDCPSSIECTAVAPAAAKVRTVDVRAIAGGKTSRKHPPGDQFAYK